MPIVKLLNLIYNIINNQKGLNMFDKFIKESEDLIIVNNCRVKKVSSMIQLPLKIITEGNYLYIRDLNGLEIVKAVKEENSKQIIDSLIRTLNEEHEKLLDYYDLEEANQIL